MTSVARRTEDSGEYSEGSQEVDHSNSGNEGEPADSDYDTPGSISDSEQDPETQEGTERRVDDDEDRSNPQYIPKRGTFYEHDDRTAASGEETTNTTSELSTEKEGSEQSSERRRPPRKSDVINKWSHDKFNENEQMPKSRDELVAIYGYDIRNEDAPPHARRNRRYGRGPNKYTRTWEDEEAYKRQTAAQAVPRKPPNPEDFPELEASRRHPRKQRTPRPRSKSQPTSNESLENGGTPIRRNASIRSPKTRPSPAIKTGVRNATVRTPPARPRRDRDGDIRRDRDGDIRRDRDGDIRRERDSGDVRNQRESGDVRNQRDSADVRNHRESGEMRNRESGDVRNRESGDARNQRDSGDVRRDREREKMPAIENLTITTVNNSEGPAQRKVLAPVAQQRPVPTEHAKKKTYAQGPTLSAAPPKSASQAQLKPQPSHQQQPQPAGSESRGGSKRYSSLRQRPLAEASYSPQPQQQQLPPQQLQQQQLPQQQLSQQQSQQLPQQQQHRYAGPGGGEFAPQASGQLAQQHPQQHIMHQQVVRNATTAHASSPPHQLPPTIPTQPPPQHAQQVRLGLLEQQQLTAVQHHTMHNMPQPHTIGQLQPTQGYAPPAMMPAQYMQSGSAGVYGGAPMYASPPAPYTHPQIYPHHNYATQAGGVTYFSCAEQEVPPPPRTTRRPTAAIPIVKPNQPDRPANSTEKDNIDRIVENMFVRKPWPATHGVDSKEKSQSERSSQEPQPKELSQPNSLTSSSISTDSKPSESIEEPREERKEVIAEPVDKVANSEPVYIAANSEPVHTAANSEPVYKAASSEPVETVETANVDSISTEA